MTGFEPRASGVGSKALPTESQPMPDLWLILYKHSTIVNYDSRVVQTKNF